MHAFLDFWHRPALKRALRIILYLAAGAGLAAVGAHLADIVALPGLAPYVGGPVGMALLAGLVGAADKAWRDREGTALGGLAPADAAALEDLARRAAEAAITTLLARAAGHGAAPGPELPEGPPVPASPPVPPAGAAEAPQG